MRTRLSLPVQVVRQVEARAAASGRTVEDQAARLIAEGAVALLSDLLHPLLSPEQAGADSSSPNASQPGLTTRADSELLTIATVASDHTGRGLNNEDEPGGTA
ncbi:MAG: hypothetical protein M0Z46_06585 [Actinomycetota bacterium]|nr:hypothetical protein [Actinomycetota bacterium]MDA8358965.1 hypothetical protein [Actinomycetota bacterium]